MKFLLLACVLIISCSKKEELILAPLLPGHKREQHESYSKKIMIATQGEASTRAGLLMIEKGGNAVDAAVAVSFAISVERPQSTGLGGGGFMLIKMAGDTQPVAIDFREMAPARAHKKMYLDKNGEEIQRLSLDGVLAGGTPGLVAGLIEAHQKYGRLPLSFVIQPAIDLALKGFEVYPHLEKSIKWRSEVIKKYPASKKIFFKTDGTPLKGGDILIQKDLAKTLKLIQSDGRKGFYEGKTADLFEQGMRPYGGLISKKDLKSYEVKWREPISTTYRDYKLFSMPPPSSGGVHIAQILKILEPFNLSQYSVQSPEVVHLTSEAMKLAFIDRARYLGDSDFVKVPVKGLISTKYLDQLRKNISLKKTFELSLEDSANYIDAFPYESDQTTHFSIMDGEGNMVSSTQTINGLMGSAFVIPGTGIVLNNEMDDFATKIGASNLFGAVGGANNLVEAKKRPLSSMSPTLVLKENKPVLVVGTPSGTRILTCVAQVLLNYLEHKLPLYESVALTRFHHQWKPEYIRYDSSGLPIDTLKGLQAKGQSIEQKDLGCKVQAVSFEKGKLHGVSDPRGEGLARGL